MRRFPALSRLQIDHEVTAHEEVRGFPVGLHSCFRVRIDVYRTYDIDVI
jgi:hypothetical protein